MRLIAGFILFCLIVGGIAYSVAAFATQRAIANRRPGTLTLNEFIPVEKQIADHPGKIVRTHMTNAMLLAQHQADVKRIAELEAEVARLKSGR